MSSPSGTATKRKPDRSPILLTVAYGAATLAGFAGRWHWLCDLASHFRMHLVLAGILPLLWFAWRKQRWGVAVVVGIWAVNFWCVAPLFLGAAELPTGKTTRILYANINASNTQHERLRDLIRTEQPDVILLAEVSPQWQRQMATLAADYPHAEHEARSDNFGIGAWSKTPFTKAEITNWGSTSIPSMAIELSGRAPIRVLFTHPLPPMSAFATTARDEQLLEVAELARTSGPRTMIVGDYNATPWCFGYSQALSRSGLRDTGAGAGWQPTWPTKFPIIFGIPIDHCWATADLTVRRRTGPDIGSDHLPLLIDVAPK